MSREVEGPPHVVAPPVSLAGRLPLQASAERSSLAEELRRAPLRTRSKVAPRALSLVLAAHAEKIHSLCRAAS